MTNQVTKLIDWNICHRHRDRLRYVCDISDAVFYLLDQQKGDIGRVVFCNVDVFYELFERGILYD